MQTQDVLAQHSPAAGSAEVLTQLLHNHSPAPALQCLQGAEPVFTWSFAALQQESTYCMQVLQACGAVSGDAVLLLSQDQPQFIAVFFACLKLKLTLLPLHADQDESSFTAIVASCQPRFCILDTELLPGTGNKIRQHPCQLLILHKRRQHWLELASGQELQPGNASLAQAGQAAGLQTGAEKSQSKLSKLWWGEQEQTEVSRQQKETENPEEQQSTAIIFHSSGTTGQPKALYYSRDQLATFLYWQQLLFRRFQDAADTTARVLPSPRINTLPLSHWGGLSFCLQALLEQRCVYLLPKFEAQALFTLLERSGCQLLMLVPAMYRELLALLQSRPVPAALRYCMTMGEAMTPGLSQALYAMNGIELYTAYGMSEALCGLAHGAEPWQQIPEGSCGRHTFGEISLRDEQGREVADEGELWIRNATTTPCYRDARLLQEKYADGWYRSGDRLRRDAQGYYFFCGRIDGMCVHNGRNVYPRQLEAVFIQHSAVQACIAAPILTRSGLRRLAVLLVCGQNACGSGSADLPDSKALMDFYLEHAALYAAPVFVLVQDSMPCTVSGKPDRSRIAGLLQQAYCASLQDTGAETVAC